MKTGRSISPLGLLFISVSSIMGSGWLFSSFYTTENAGPAALLSWIIGGFLVLIVAFTFAEVFSFLPVSGGSVRIPQISHGNVIGIFCSLAFWFLYIVLVVIEVQAVVQYLCFYFPSFMTQKESLSFSGYITATVLLFVVSIVNTISMKWVARCNLIMTFVKILIPLFIGIFLLILYFSWENLFHPFGSQFSPFGAHGIFAAISTGGIIFSYIGFKSACEVGGEAQKPSFSIPFAVIGSILVCMGIFLVLQSSFIVSLQKGDIKEGWAALTLLNNNSPFASLMAEHSIKWMIPILYIGAIVSPLASGLIYCTCASRSLLSIAVNGYAPKILVRTNKNQIPFFTIWINFLISLVIFSFSRGWHQIADLLTYLFALTFVFGPICLIALRLQIPERKRYVKLPFVWVWTYVSLFLCTLFIYWVGWSVNSITIYFLIFCMIVALIVQIITNTTKAEMAEQWKSSLWLWIFSFVIYLCSYMGSYGGGHKILSEGTIMLIFAIMNALTIYLAVKFKKKPEEVKAETDYI